MNTTHEIHRLPLVHRGILDARDRLPFRLAEPASADSSTALQSLLEYFRYAQHAQEGLIDDMGLGVTEAHAINLGWLRRVKGPGRLDDDWLVPSGGLAALLLETRGSAVVAAWDNYREMVP